MKAVSACESVFAMSIFQGFVSVQCPGKMHDFRQLLLCPVLQQPEIQDTGVAHLRLTV